MFPELQPNLNKGRHKHRLFGPEIQNFLNSASRRGQEVLGGEGLKMKSPPHKDISAGLKDDVLHTRRFLISVPFHVPDYWNWI
jgi:hypothetical protein